MRPAGPPPFARSVADHGRPIDHGRIRRRAVDRHVGNKIDHRSDVGWRARVQRQRGVGRRIRRGDVERSVGRGVRTHVDPNVRADVGAQVETQVQRHAAVGRRWRTRVREPPIVELPAQGRLSAAEFTVGAAASAKRGAGVLGCRNGSDVHRD
jgi:hypothetical protein